MIALARSTDPETSHKAAEEVSSNGVQADQQRQTVAAVRVFPGRTSQELAAATGLDRYMLARRLGECEARGLLRRGPARCCEVSHRAALTWWPGGAP